MLDLLLQRRVIAGGQHEERGNPTERLIAGTYRPPCWAYGAITT
jgi:hypothetical protein